VGVGIDAEQRHTAVGQAVRLQPFEDLLRVVQYGGRWVHGYRGARLHARVVPAFALGVLDRHHVVGEHPAEAGIGQERFALGPGDRRWVRVDLELVFHGGVPSI